MSTLRIKHNATLTSSMTVQMWEKTSDQCFFSFADLLAWLKTQLQHISTNSRFNLERIAKLTLLL